MKLIQSNIWGGKLKFQLQDFFEDQQSDIACLQEVNDLEGPGGALFTTLDEIKSSGNFTHKSMASLNSLRYMRRTMYYGNATLSKFPIVAQNVVFTYGEYKDNFDLIDGDDNMRNLQHVVVQTPDGSLHVLNHHGFFIAGSKKGGPETVRQMSLIADYIKNLSGPVILCGDFNLTPDSESMRVFSGLLTDLSSKYGLTDTYTNLSFNNAVVDYILVNDEVTVNHFEMSEKLISDHNALILDFDI